MDEPQAMRVEVPAITVRSGDRVSTVPSWPMPLAGVRDRAVELEADESGALVLRPRRGSRRRGIILGLLVLIPGLFGIGVSMYLLYQEAVGFGRVLWWIGLLILVALLGLVFLSWLSSGTSIRFDRESGLITHSRRPFGFLRKPRVYQTTSLAEVVCVQLIYNGFHSEYQEMGAGEQSSLQLVQYYCYQMNLVLKRDAQPRMNLALHSDWAWMRSAGGRLAEYLQVPLVDQLHHD